MELMYNSAAIRQSQCCRTLGKTWTVTDLWNDPVRNVWSQNV